MRKCGRRILVFGLFVCVYACGCATSVNRETRTLKPECDGLKCASHVWLTEAVYTTNMPPRIRVKAEGRVTTQWRERPCTEVVMNETCFEYDQVTFRRLTKKVPPFSLTGEYFGARANIGTAKLRPLLWVAGDPHPFGDLVSFDNSSCDRMVDSSVFPRTFSGEEAVAAFLTAVYPITLVMSLLSDDEKNYAYRMAPVTLIGSPVCDIAMYARYLAGLAAVVSADAVLTSVSLAADGMMWMGDAVCPSKVTRTRRAVEYGEWRELKQETSVDWASWSVNLKCDAIEKKALFAADGSSAIATLPLEELRVENRGSRGYRVDVTLCDDKGVAVGGQTKSVEVDFEDLLTGGGNVDRTRQ